MEGHAVMATTINKTRILNSLLSTAPAPGQGEGPLTVLEQFVFALCRENATPEQAQQAFHNLRTQFFDWNEIRVSSPRELEEAMEGLSDTESRAQRLISFLQEVFETTFSFDLSGLEKKGLKQAAKSLLGFGASSEFVGAWVVQRSLGGHAIPVDPPTLRCARRLGLVESHVEDPEAARATLEHQIPKARGAQFSDAISTVAEQFCWEDEPRCQGCPLNSECPTAQEQFPDQLATARTARTKPR
jgi:endonuclease-3